MHIVSNAIIVFDNTARVNNTMFANPCTRIDRRIRHNNTSLADRSIDL